MDPTALGPVTAPKTFDLKDQQTFAEIDHAQPYTVFDAGAHGTDLSLSSQRPAR